MDRLNSNTHLMPLPWKLLDFTLIFDKEFFMIYITLSIEKIFLKRFVFMGWFFWHS